jgi:enterochelin esterase family protein
MLIVMPNGVPTAVGRTGSPEGINCSAELLSDIIPMIDRTYRVGGRENRAITSLSMGGGQTFTIGLKHLICSPGWESSVRDGQRQEFRLEKHLPGFLNHPRT